MKAQELFEDELASRGLPWSIEAGCGRHLIEIHGARLLVSLANLERDFAADADAGKITRFVDAIIESEQARVETLSAERLFWILEPNDYEEPPDFRVPVSQRADRVLVHLSFDGKLVSWATNDLLQSLNLTIGQAEGKGFANLERALLAATLETSDVDGVPLGVISTPLPFKTALILAPNLKEIVEEKLGWPVLAVAPDRDFLYLWPEQHSDFADRIGTVVVREYTKAPYPISPEIFELSDQGVRAIGAF